MLFKVTRTLVFTKTIEADSGDQAIEQFFEENPQIEETVRAEYNDQVVAERVDKSAMADSDWYQEGYKAAMQDVAKVAAPEVIVTYQMKEVSDA